MRRASICGIILVSAACSCSATQAQKAASRCGGWPGAPGVPGLVVADPGRSCSGQLFNNVKGRALIDVKVLHPPAQSRFEMTGLRTFTLAAGGLAAPDSVTLMVTWNENGQTVTREKILRIVSTAQYFQNGGNLSAPGAGMTTSRFSPRKNGKVMPGNAE